MLSTLKEITSYQIEVENANKNKNKIEDEIKQLKEQSEKLNFLDSLYKISDHNINIK